MADDKATPAAGTPGASAAGAGATPTPDAAAAAVAANITFDTQAISNILESLYGDAGLAGGGIAQAQTGNAAGDFATVLPAIDWSKWVPGDADTASLISNGGLKRILDSLDITIRGLTESAMSRMGNVLADGISAGDGSVKIARDMRDIIADPKRALVIARTEVARAMGASTLDSFKDEHIAQWRWHPNDGACPVCLKYAAGSPYDVGSGPDFPGHPCCRCLPLAVLDFESDQ